MDPKSRARLIHLLISKSVAEVLLISAATIAFFFVTTNPGLRGVLDQADKQVIMGWAVNDNDPAARVELQLFVYNRFVSVGVANQYRPDVHEANRAADDWHGFSFQTPPLSAGQHEARVYAI